MKKIILFFISFTTLAETYDVTTSRGHSYTYLDDSQTVSLKSKRVSFTMPRKSCADLLLKDLKAYFEKQLKIRSTSKENVLFVKHGNTTFGVPEGIESGKRLTFFPDHFAKTYLVYKELCK